MKLITINLCKVSIMAGSNDQSIDLGVVPDAEPGEIIRVRLIMPNGDTNTFDAMASGTSEVRIVGAIYAEGTIAPEALMQAGAELARDQTATSN